METIRYLLIPTVGIALCLAITGAAPAAAASSGCGPTRALTGACQPAGDWDRSSEAADVTRATGAAGAGKQRADVRGTHGTGVLRSIARGGEL